MKEPRVFARDTGAVKRSTVCRAEIEALGLAKPGPKSEPRSEILQVLVPIRTVNSTNAREHWGGKARRVKKEREAVAWMLAGKRPPALPCRVLLTRLGPNRRLCDSDGLQAAGKGVRDQVAAWLGVDDADPRVKWEYAQERAPEYGVRIEVEHQGTGNG